MMNQWFLDSKDHDLVAVVPVKPEPTWTASITNWASNNSVKVIDSGHYKDLGVDVDLAFSVFYDKIIKKVECFSFKIRNWIFVFFSLGMS